MFLLLSVAFASREMPIVFFPPMFGSVLYGTLTNLQSEHWFCPRNLKDSWIWETDQYLIPPLTDCLADYLTCAWNESAKKPWSRPEAEIYTIDFGGTDGIRYLDRGIFGFHFVHCLDVLLERFEQDGYSTKIDMFGFPFDWRLNPVSLEDFFQRAHDWIELVNLQCQHKPTLIGYSAGCFAMHQFLVKACTQEWKDANIKKIVMIAPSYGGGMSALEIVWTKQSWFPGADSKSMMTFCNSLPTMYAHMPNWVVYGEKEVLKGPNGEGYKAYEVRAFADKMGKIYDQFKPIWEYVEENVVREELADPGVDAFFLINTGLETRAALVFNESWEQMPYFYEFEDGDSVLNRDTLMWGCEHWRSGHSVVCSDYRLDNMSYSHGSMLAVPEVREDVYNAVVNESWMVPGNWLYEGKRTDNWLKQLKRI